MAFDIASHLEKAKLVHRLSSDYKLALVMGISHSALTNYRQGKTLPDARVISILCDLTGEDSGLMLAQVEEMRAKTDEARALWHQIAERLQAGAATAVFAVAFFLASMVGLPMADAHAQASNSNFSSYTSWNVAKGGMTRLFWRLVSPAVRYFRMLFRGKCHVSCSPSIAHA